MILFLLWYLAVGYFIDRWHERQDAFDGLTVPQVVMIRALLQFGWPVYVLFFVYLVILNYVRKLF
jgi:hypothetical protein